MTAQPKNTIRLLLALLLWVACGPVWAQDSFAELNLLRNRYADLKNYSSQLVFKAYKGHTSTELVDQQTGQCEVSGDRFRLVMGPSTMLKNERYCLNVNDRFREIEVLDATKHAVEMPYGNFNRIDSILRKNKALSVTPQTDGTRLLIVDLKNSGDEYEKITVRYKPLGELVSIAFFYRGKASLYGIEDNYKARVEIEYRAQNFNAVFTADHFSEKKYVVVNDGQITPQPAYKNYEIFDLL